MGHFTPTHSISIFSPLLPLINQVLWDAATWQSTNTRLNQLGDAMCHDPCTNKQINQILPYHCLSPHYYHLLHKNTSHHGCHPCRHCLSSFVDHHVVSLHHQTTQTIALSSSHLSLYASVQPQSSRAPTLHRVIMRHHKNHHLPTSSSLRLWMTLTMCLLLLRIIIFAQT